MAVSILFVQMPQLGDADKCDGQDGEIPSRQHKKETTSRESNSTPVYGEEVTSFLPDNTDQGQINAQNKGASFLRHRFGKAWTKKRQATDEDSNRGPLGLRLLHSSPQPLIDLIFVHGLRGGSIKTWRKGHDPRLFWPQHWLPMEAGLSNASIHSFGYDSDWGSTTPSILNVHDFGRALYEEMRSSPFLRQNSNSTIILIGHSMGGLVVKKAFVLAHQDIAHPQLAERIRCIFFLATPHRGSDYAAILNSILKVSGISRLTSSREYINDLKTGSISAQLINEDFSRHANDLPIYSFYETLPLTSVSSSLIVEKESAILGAGFRNETSTYMNANHRTICKFDSPEDSNYLSLKNILTSAVQDLLRDVFISQGENRKSQLRTIQSFLGISSVPDEYHEKVEGSCQWIDDRDDFREWKDAPDELETSQDTSYSPSLYWITANPGAGKSVLASHVVSELQEFRLQAAFYYFHVGNKASQSLAYFLRSLAYQMAASNTAVGDAVVKLYNDGITFDQDDARAIWSKVFRAGILQLSLFTPQYWVIDAIDECVEYADIFTLLKGTKSRFPLRIFITSRRVPDMQKFVRQIQGCVVSNVEIPVVETMRDIDLFVRNRMEVLSIDSDDEKQQLIEKILSKSKDSFLWARLVMDELGGVYGYESIMSVLQEIPEGMKSYYQRTVTEMAEDKREKHIAKAILLWVVCAARPLSISELSEALKLDIKIHFPSAKAAIEGLCGQLVTVDKQTNQVHIVHLSAREFLLSDDAGEFKISKSDAHQRISLACLQLLVSPAMQPPRHRRLVGQKRPEQATSVLLDYSITQFSEHVFGAPVESDNLLVALDKFLTTTILRWIDRVVSKKYLHHLILVARNLKAYLDRRAKRRSPLNRYIGTINGWATDLSRLATKFGGALSSQPQSIYFLIPPLCPTETAIYQQFGRSSDGLVVLGFKNTSWDDCAATINFETETAAAVTCDNSLIAVGFESGNICLYNNSSFQKENMIINNDPIDLLLLDPLGTFIASSNIKYITIWDLKGNLLWQRRLRSRCIQLTSSSTFIVGVTMSGQAFRWDIATGELIEEHRYPYQPLDSTDLVKAPFKASFSHGFELLALAYQNGPTCIYELQTHSWIAWASDRNVRQVVVDLVFNPNPDLYLLLLAYDDSHLVLYDSWSGAIIQSQESESHAILTSLSCSSDGRTFGTVDVLGNLKIWDFTSLTLLYHIVTPSYSFRILEFTSDGFNLVDVVDQEMKIWSPSALVRKTVEEEASTSEQAAILPVSEGQFVAFQSYKIRCTVVHRVFPAVFVGNYHGDVMVYNTTNSEDGKATTLLYSHQTAMVKCLAVTNNNIIASGDVGGRVQVWQLDSSCPTMIKIDKAKFQARFTAAIRQILFDNTGEYLLVSTMDSDHVYDVNSGTLIGSLNIDGTRRSVWKWMALPDAAQPGNFMLASNHELVYYSANAFPTEVGNAHIKLDFHIEDGFIESAIDSAVLHQESMSLILDIRQQRGFETACSSFIFKLPELFTDGALVTLQPARTLGSTFCMHFLGISRADKRLIFLNRDSWVSSIDPFSLDNNEYLQHFFVPSEFLTNSSDILPMQTADDSFVFCLYDKFAVVKNGLIFKELKVLE